PTTKAEADAQFERMLDSPPTVQNPKFLEWGAALHARYPEAMDVWLDGSEDGTTTAPVLGFGVNTRSDHWADGFDWAWAQATRLG
ncbi:UNVERIFIED_CONTAM: sel1 repeat family protein, partial [Salmonella enterica subsp. enterica serovar Weltevreden]